MIEITIEEYVDLLLYRFSGKRESAINYLEEGFISLVDDIISEEAEVDYPAGRDAGARVQLSLDAIKTLSKNLRTLNKVLYKLQTISSV